MNRPAPRPGGGVLDDLFSDPLELLAVIVAVMLVGGGFATMYWERCRSWLLHHQLIVPAAEKPLVALPAAHGAGLDLPRLLIGVLLVAALGLTGLAWWLRHHHRPEEQ